MNQIVSAEKLDKEGKSHYNNGKYLQAARVFETASQIYNNQNEELNAAEAANNASVAYLQADLPGDALRIVEFTPPIFSRYGELKRQGMALGNLASALEALDRDDEALEVYNQSAEVLLEAGEDQLRASVMQSLSMLQFRKGQQLQALATMQNSLDNIQKPDIKQSFLKRLISIPIQMMTKNR